MDQYLLVNFEHARGLGLAALAHGLQHTMFFKPTSNPYMIDLAVLQVAHAAEVLIKACMAEKDPLSIFINKSGLKQSNIDTSEPRNPIEFEEMKTYLYSELPKKLQAITGYKMSGEALTIYKNFDKKRNAIQHLISLHSVEDLEIEILKFVFNVIDPIIYHFWKLYAIDYFEQPDAHNYIIEKLLRYDISFSFPDHYQKVVNSEMFYLGALVKAIDFILSQASKEKVVTEIQHELDKIWNKHYIDTSSWCTEEIYWEAYNTLLNDESYKNWRTLHSD